MTTLTDAEVIAVAVVDLARRGKFAEVEGAFAPGLRALVSAESLHADWTGKLAGTGPVTSISAPTHEAGERGLARVSVPVNCERGGLTVIMSVDRGGNLHGLRLASPDDAEWTPPSYADPKRLTEQEITLGTGASAVPGVLTLPLAHGRRPAVVLPGDDETGGADRPVKDLAWGLATHGVASARFGGGEYVAHALAAIRLLRGHFAVDPKRVSVVADEVDASAVGVPVLSVPGEAGAEVVADLAGKLSC